MLQYQATPSTVGASLDAQAFFMHAHSMRVAIGVAYSMSGSVCQKWASVCST